MYILNDMLNEDEISLSKFKKEIIIDKNDLLFGYIEKISPIFDELKIDIENSLKFDIKLILIW